MSLQKRFVWIDRETGIVLSCTPQHPAQLASLRQVRGHGPDCIGIYETQPDGTTEHVSDVWPVQ